MVSNSISPLEIKSLDSKKAPKKSKNDDNSFKNEMLENEKRMKKKSVDGRESTGQSHAARSQKSTSTKQEPPKQTSRTEKFAAGATEKQANQIDKQQAGASAAGNTGESKVTAELPAQAKAISTDTVAKAEFTQEMMAELQTAGIDMASLQKKDGKLSIEGMQLVQPQMLQTSATSAVEPSAEIASAVETILAAAPPAVEQKSSDLLSQDFNQDFSGFNSGSEFSAVQNTMVKENAPNQQAFAAVLDSKVQNPEQVRENNIENMITQARAILKDGGGEMTLKLSPEGMGTVDLKVVTENGQVSVEIITQDQTVKKMFEDSVFDIRGALESQNLKIDTFKVGVSENFDQTMGQQNGAQQQFEEREFARDFMGQFRNERQGFRQQGIDSVLNGRTPANARPEGLSPASSKHINGRLNIIA